MFSLYVFLSVPSTANRVFLECFDAGLLSGYIMTRQDVRLGKCSSHL